MAERAALPAVSGLLYAAGAVTALWLATRFGAAFPWLTAGVTALVVAVAIGAAVALPAGAVVLAVLALAAARFTPQTVVALRAHDLSGVSAAAWWATAAEGLVWLVYGVAAGLLQAAVWGVMALVAGVLIASRAAWSAHRLGRRPPVSCGD